MPFVRSVVAPTFATLPSNRYCSDLAALDRLSLVLINRVYLLKQARPKLNTLRKHCLFLSNDCCVVLEIQVRSFLSVVVFVTVISTDILALKADTFLGTTSSTSVKFLSASAHVAEGTYPIFIDQPAAKGFVTGDVIAEPLLIAETLSINGIAVSLEIGDNILGIINKINDFIFLTGIQASIAYGTTDQITLATVEYGSSFSVVSTGTGAGFTTSVQTGFGTHIAGRIGHDFEFGNENILLASEIELCFLPDAAGLTTGSGNMGTVTITHCEGSFFEVQAYPAGNQPRVIGTGDFNGDGIADLITGNGLSDDVSILSGVGDGSFRLANSLSVGGTPVAIAAVDLNKDGNTDFAVANSLSDGISVFLSTGNNAFVSTGSFITNGAPFWLTSNDLNGDGSIDIATANGLSNDVAVLLGKGDGSFSAASNFEVGDFPGSITSTDLNGDGFIDLVTANGFSDNVSVLLGMGDGTFAEAYNFEVGALPNSIVAGDFDGDSLIDIATASDFYNEISVALGFGDGTFTSANFYPAGDTPMSLVTSDFNGDEYLDLVTANLGSNDVTIMLGNGQGAFAVSTNFLVGDFPGSITIGNFDGNETKDLAVAVRDTDAVNVLLNSCRFGGVLLGDVNLDGEVNLLDVASFVRVLEIGSFQHEADINQDGSVDLLDLEPFVEILGP